ncbi:TraV family lipoprotein [uncultured Desulfobulbus sp.]|uniref:TraV family lipoprotein n=1 Tax=uncultured Desulfobulbus sp. TaxID=239745 RepID=UPI0029C7B131|nr:TraV family lipoprotein [uncultured Desulfobulbus sp.]
MMRIIAYLAALVLVSGCAGVKDAVNPYEENFRCKARDSEGKCLDTPTAYKEARLPDNQGIETNSINISQIEAQNSRYKALTDLLEAPETPVLNPPKILRVLLLPYRGENNELFMTRYAYLEIEPSQWALTEVSEKKP